MLKHSDIAAARHNVLITGATSGIGQATARLLAREGYRVFGTGRNPSASNEGGVELLPLEVTSNESVAACVEEVQKRTGGLIDVLINNVGTGILAAAEESSIEQVQELFDINFFGAVRMTNAVLPVMRQRRQGCILMLSSAGGIASVPFAAYYCATKHALEAYSESLRLELDRLGIHVVIVAPGTVSTNAGEKAMKPDRPLAEYQKIRHKTTEAYIQAIHQGMSPDEVATVIMQILRTSSPGPRHQVGLQSAAVTAMKSWLPARLFEAGAKRMIHQ